MIYVLEVKALVSKQRNSQKNGLVVAHKGVFFSQRNFPLKTKNFMFANL